MRKLNFHQVAACLACCFLLASTHLDDAFAAQDAKTVEPAQNSIDRELAFLLPSKIDKHGKRLLQKLIKRPASKHQSVLNRINGTADPERIFSAILRPVEDGRNSVMRGSSGKQKFLLVSNSPRLVGNPFFHQEVMDTCRFLVKNYPDSELAILASIELARADNNLDALCALRTKINQFGKTKDLVLFRFWECGLQMSPASVACQLIQPDADDFRILTQALDENLSYEDSIAIARLLDKNQANPLIQVEFAKSVANLLPKLNPGDDASDHRLIRELLSKNYRMAQLHSFLIEGCHATSRLKLFPALEPYRGRANSALRKAERAVEPILDETMEYIALIDYLQGDIRAFYQDFEEPSLSFPAEVTASDNVFQDIIQYNRSGVTTHLDDLIERMPQRMRSRYLPVLKAFALRRDGKTKQAIQQLLTGYREKLERYDADDEAWSKRALSFWKFINYQLAIWYVESDDLELALKAKPSKRFFWLIVSDLRLGEQWLRLHEFLDFGLELGVVSESDILETRQQTFFELRQFKEAISTFDAAFGNTPIGTLENKLDVSYAIRSALHLGELETARRLVQLQSSDDRINDIGQHRFAFRLALLENNLEDAKSHLKRAMKKEWYEPFNDSTLDVSHLSDQQRSELFGTAADFEFDMDMLFLNGSQWSIYSRSKNLLSAPQILARLKPVVGASLQLNSVELDDQGQKVWQAKIAGKLITICDRELAVGEFDFQSDQTRNKLKLIRKATSIHFSAVTPSPKRSHDHPVSIFEVAKALLDDDSLLLGNHVFRNAHSQLWLKELGPGELDRLSRHGFATTSHYPSLTLPTLEKTRQQQSEISKCLAAFINMEAPEKQLNIGFINSAGLATELLEVSVDQVIRRPDGQVELSLTMQTDSKLDPKLKQGIKGRLVFDDTSPVESQLSHIGSISIISDKEKIKWPTQRN